MTSRQWLSRTAAAIAVILCVNFAVAYVLDPYGVMRDTRGRELRVVFSARKAKYLLSKHYVPTNYDSLIIGPSSSENWDPTGIPGVKLYNESILGSNVFEEKRIVDQAMPNGHFKLALCILYPTMTSNHQMNDGLDAVSTAEAFGSIHLYVHEANQILAALHLPTGRLSAPDGATPLKPVPPSFDTIQFDPSYFNLDPVAVSAYSQMVRDLSTRGARIVYIIPPLFQPCLTLNEKALADYKQSMRRLLPPAPLVDFNGPEFKPFRIDESNYLDCFHVSASGAEKIDTYLAQQVPAALAN